MELFQDPDCLQVSANSSDQHQDSAQRESHPSLSHCHRYQVKRALIICSSVHNMCRHRAGELTDPVQAMRYLQSKDVDLVYSVPALVRVLDKFARYLYEMNIEEQEFQP